MKYAVYKLKFNTGVHFGNGALSSSNSFFPADTLFSALYTEAVKLGCSDSLFDAAKNGDMLISDAFPYIGSSYYLPKPMIYIEPHDKGDSTLKKAYKKMKYIPAELFKDYIAGNLDPKSSSIVALGEGTDQIMASVGMGEADAEPYSVGTFSFADGNGLYIIAGFADDDAEELFEEIMDSLSYSGIGGKRSSGKGRFSFNLGGNAESLLGLIRNKTGRYMLLSSALPTDRELDTALEGASYMLQKRSGFVYSETFAETNQKKRDMYTMQAGSCFSHKFAGDIYDVSDGKGSHPVYRYAKALFAEV